MVIFGIRFDVGLKRLHRMLQDWTRRDGIQASVRAVHGGSLVRENP